MMEIIKQKRYQLCSFYYMKNTISDDFHSLINQENYKVLLIKDRSLTPLTFDYTTRKMFFVYNSENFSINILDHS